MANKIDVVEDYKKRRLRITQQGWEAELGWTVAWAKNEAQALQQPEIPVLYAPHRLSAALQCTWVGVDEYNFNLTRVRAIYKEAQISGVADPLKQPLVMQFSESAESKAVDRDALGNPLVVSTGDPIVGVHRTFLRRRFTITRNEPYWDPRKDAVYADSYNSKPFAPLGFPAMEPGQCHCLSILPGSPIQKNLKYVPIIYSFEYGQGVSKGKDGVWDAFKFVKADLASFGWYKDASGKYMRGRFIDGWGEPMNEVALDGTGRPIDQNIRIAPGNNVPVAPPAGSSTPAQIVKLTKPPGNLLVYTMLNAADFNDFHF